MAIKRMVAKAPNADVIMLNEAFLSFIEEKEATNKSASTVSSYKKTYKKWCERFGEEVEASEVDQSIFYEWCASMKADGLRPASINHYLRDMRAFMRWCMDSSRGYIQTFKIAEVTLQEEMPKFYTQEEQALLTVKPHRGADYPEWRMWAISNFILATGCRTSTLVEVRKGDVDFKTKRINYRHNKNHKAQTIPLSTTLANVLKEYIRVWRNNVDDDAYLFANIGEERLTPDALRIAFRKYTQLRGVDKTSIHGLRHTFAREWVINDGSMIQLQKMLGHSTLEMTRKYIRLFGDEMAESFDEHNPLDNLKKNASRRKVVTRNA